MQNLWSFKVFQRSKFLLTSMCKNIKRSGFIVSEVFSFCNLYWRKLWYMSKGWKTPETLKKLYEVQTFLDTNNLRAIIFDTFWYWNVQLKNLCAQTRCSILSFGKLESCRHRVGPFKAAMEYPVLTSCSLILATSPNIVETYCRWALTKSNCNLFQLMYIIRNKPNFVLNGFRQLFSCNDSSKYKKELRLLEKSPRYPLWEIWTTIYLLNDTIWQVQQIFDILSI